MVERSKDKKASTAAPTEVSRGVRLEATTLVVGAHHRLESVSSSCHTKNPKAETAKAIMPTSSKRQLKGGNST